MCYLFEFIFTIAGCWCLGTHQEPTYVFSCFAVAALYCVAGWLRNICHKLKDEGEIKLS